MKDNRLKGYIGIGLTAFSVIVASALIIILIWRFGTVVEFVKNIVDVAMPIIIGFVLAYVLNPIVKILDKLLMQLFKERLAKKHIRKISVFISIIFLISLIVGLILLVVPQIISNINGLILNIPSYFNAVTQTADELLGKLDSQVAVYVEEQFSSAIANIQESLSEALPYVNRALTSITQGAIGFLVFIKNFALGLIVAIYLLYGKEKMSAQLKKILYGFFKKENMDILIRRVNDANQIFGGFIFGKIVDSIIVGILCFIGTSILQIPYALLISVVMCCMNVIPFFGPIIGTTSCGLLLLMVDPLRCLWFVLFALILMQIDGNIIEPKIVGEYTGLSAFWVIFSITIGGGLFGIPGMFLSVPVFAVIYAVVRSIVGRKLKAKDLPIDTQEYMKETVSTIEQQSE